MERLKNLRNDQLYCSICDTVVSGTQNAKVHYEGRKHKMMEGIYSTRSSIAERSVFINNLPLMTTEIQLTDLMNQFGIVSQVYLDRTDGAFAIVEFADVKSNQRALMARKINCDGQLISIFPRKIKPNKRKTVDDPSLVQQFEKLLQKTILNLQKCQTLKAQFDTLISCLSLSSQQVSLRVQSLNLIQHALIPFYPKCFLKIYGSTMNGFGFNYCDMDITIFIPETEDKLYMADKLTVVPSPDSVLKGVVTREQLYTLPYLETLKFISFVLKKRVPQFTKVTVIPSTRCPIVRFFNKPLGISCDLSFGKRVCVRNTQLLRFLGELEGRLQRLVIALRLWAKIKKLIGSGTVFTSYAFTWLVIFYLQNTAPPVLPTIEELQNTSEVPDVVDGFNTAFCQDTNKLPKLQNQDNIEDLFKGFFGYYLNTDFATKGLCPRNGKLVNKTELKDELILYGTFKLSCITVQDPFEINRNITANVSESSLVFFLECLDDANQAVKNPEFNLWPGMVLLLDPVESHQLEEKKIEKKPFNETTADLTFNIQLTEKYYSDGQSTLDVLTTLSQTIIDILEFSLLMKCTIIDSVLKLKTNSKCEERGTLDLVADHNTAEYTSDVAHAEDAEERFVKRAKIEETAFVEPCLLKIPLAYIKCTVMHRVWHGRRKINIANTELSVLEKEREISEIVVRKSGETSQPLFEFNVNFIEQQKQGITLLDVNLKYTQQIKEFNGTVSSFLLAYLPRIINSLK